MLWGGGVLRGACCGEAGLCCVRGCLVYKPVACWCTSLLLPAWCTSMGEDFHESSLSAPSARPMAVFEVGISPLVLGWLRWSWAGGLRRPGLRCRLLGSHLPRSSV